MKLFSLLFFPALAASVSLTASKNIVEVAAGTPDLSTLVTALKAGNLTGALAGPGPFTVFAPTNEAFTKLPSSVLKYLLEPANIKKLQAVLEYHVIAGAAIFSKDLKEYQKVKTLEGGEVSVIKKDSRVFVNLYAEVSTADVGASNGVVHIINRVLIPVHIMDSIPLALSAKKNIVELAAGTPDLSTLVTALKAGNLTGALAGPGPFTVFAPTNEAFAKLPSSVLKYLLEPANIKKLQAVLEYHVVAGAAVYSKDLKEYQVVKTMEGSEVSVIKKDSRVFVNMYAEVTTADVSASNGVVHIINHVLIPKHFMESTMIEAVVSSDSF